MSISSDSADVRLAQHVKIEKFHSDEERLDPNVEPYEVVEAWYEADGTRITDEDRIASLEAQRNGSTDGG